MEITEENCCGLGGVSYGIKFDGIKGGWARAVKVAEAVIKISDKFHAECTAEHDIEMADCFSASFTSGEKFLEGCMKLRFEPDDIRFTSVRKGNWISGIINTVNEKINIVGGISSDSKTAADEFLAEIDESLKSLN